MSRFEIKFLYRRHEDISSKLEYIGGINSDGSKWKLHVEKMIEYIDSGKWKFYIIKDNFEFEVTLNNQKDDLIVIFDKPFKSSLEKLILD